MEIFQAIKLILIICAIGSTKLRKRPTKDFLNSCSKSLNIITQFENTYCLNKVILSNTSWIYSQTNWINQPVISTNTTFKTFFERQSADQMLNTMIRNSLTDLTLNCLSKTQVIKAGTSSPLIILLMNRSTPFWLQRSSKDF